MMGAAQTDSRYHHTVPLVIYHGGGKSESRPNPREIEKKLEKSAFISQLDPPMKLAVTRHFKLERLDSLLHTHMGLLNKGTKKRYKTGFLCLKIVSD